MKQAYVPALEVSRHASLKRVRELPIQGSSLVKVGDKVESTTEVLRAELPGEVSVIRVAERMGFEPEDVIRGIKFKPGDTLTTGDLLCELKTFFGFFTTRLTSPIGGTVEFFTEANAHLGIREEPVPISIPAYVRGEVVAVREGKSVEIATEGSFVQGVFGVGGERQGVVLPLTCPNDAKVSSEFLEKELGNTEGGFGRKILIGGGAYEKSALEFAAKHGVSAVVCGSIDADTLFDFVGHEIGVSITGDEDVPFTLIVTEGFGELAISSRVTELAAEVSGMEASVNGATQVRAGATRPEVIVPRLGETGEHQTVRESKPLEPGARVRLIRVPYFGEFGSVTELPTEPELIESGAKVRVLRAELEDGRVVTVPRANVELL